MRHGVSRTRQAAAAARQRVRRRCVETDHASRRPKLCRHAARVLGGGAESGVRAYRRRGGKSAAASRAERAVADVSPARGSARGAWMQSAALSAAMRPASDLNPARRMCSSRRSAALTRCLGRGDGGGGERKSARRRRLTPRRHRALVGGALGLVREDGGGGAVTRRLCVARPARELECACVEMRLHVGDRDAGGDAAHEREEEEVGGLRGDVVWLLCLCQLLRLLDKLGAEEGRVIKEALGVRAGRRRAAPRLQRLLQRAQAAREAPARQRASVAKGGRRAVLADSVAECVAVRVDGHTAEPLPRAR
mmetsp:Transcript_4051/g.12975  ORF Transcript_4051/g.12975 Transcript_4051/m.12975 type:complete len:308 (-) Transcript_4051:1033-1956(-)